MRLHHTHPRLLMAFALAAAVGLAAPWWGLDEITTRLLIGWLVGTGSYLILAGIMIKRSTPETLRRRARLQAESRGVTIGLVTMLTVVGLAIIVTQLMAVKQLPLADRTAHIAMVIVTILSSWAFTHTMFALQYAHDYFDAIAKHQTGGLEFAGTDTPDYIDFLYCAFIIGTSGQTADVAFSSSGMRRLGLVHSVLSFLFNTVVLAMTINIAASFVQ